MGASALAGRLAALSARRFKDPARGLGVTRPPQARLNEDGWPFGRFGWGGEAGILNGSPGEGVVCMQSL